MTKFIWLLLAVLFTGCVSQSNLFQDGKPLGKKITRSSAGLSFNSTPGFEPDSINNRVKVKPYHFLVPLAHLQVQYGLTEKLDVGGAFHLGLLSVGAEAFAKYAFLPAESKFNVALYAGGGLSGSNDQSVEKGSVGFSHAMVALPVSFDISGRSTIVIQPIYDHHHYKFTIDGSTREYKGVFWADLYKLGLGFIHKHSDDLKIHYNVALNYWEKDQRYWPSFGIAFSKP